MAKQVSLRPERLKAESVTDIYSIANCISRNFADYMQYWRQNRYWFFDSPTIIQPT